MVKAMNDFIHAVEKRDAEKVDAKGKACPEKTRITVVVKDIPANQPGQK